MKILILTFYYNPDLCAGSFRCTQLVEQLQSQMDSTTTLDIITTMPNRYSSFKQSALALEKHQNTTIHRIQLPEHKSGFLDQAKAFLHYAKSVRKLTKNEDYDVVFATSSRLMTAVLGRWIAKAKKAKLYLDIRDIFADTIGDILPKKVSLLAQFFFSTLEHWTFKAADHINLVSYGFNDYFKQKYPNTNLSFYTNGIDAEFLNPEPLGVQDQKPPVILYAGNIGEGQGLHLIIPALAKKMPDYHFKVIGDGGKIELLKAATLHQSNVEIRPPMPRSQLIKEYQQADILFLHLNHHQAFLKVLPSKLFEYAAINKPILAGVGGYAAEFITQEITNAAVFEPCNSQAAINAMPSLQLKYTSRDQFRQKFDRKKIMDEMSRSLLNLV